jgi:hypothetical protein
MSTVKQKLNSLKNHVYENRGLILTSMLAGTTATTVFMLSLNLHHDQFLKEKGLYDEFWKTTKK